MPKHKKQKGMRVGRRFVTTEALYKNGTYAGRIVKCDAANITVRYDDEKGKVYYIPRKNWSKFIRLDLDRDVVTWPLTVCLQCNYVEHGKGYPGCACCGSEQPRKSISLRQPACKYEAELLRRAVQNNEIKLAVAETQTTVARLEPDIKDWFLRSLRKIKMKREAFHGALM